MCSPSNYAAFDFVPGIILTPEKLVEGGRRGGAASARGANKTLYTCTKCGKGVKSAGGLANHRKAHL